MHRRQFLRQSVSATLAGGMALSIAGAQQVAIKKYAFVAGVAKYQKDGFSNLEYAEDDARDLATELKGHGFSVFSLVGKEATRAKLEQELTRFFQSTKNLSKEDIVLVALSGHGRQALKGQEEHPYFCPYDAHSSDTTTMLSLNWVMDRMKEDSSSSQNLLLVDACRDNPSRGGKGVDGSTVTGLPNKLSVLFSSSAGRQSYESEQVKHGIFTHFVLTGLRGKAADEDGEVTWLGLSSYVMKQVRKEAPKLVQREQEPNLLGNLVRQPVLASLDRKQPGGPPPMLIAPFGEAEAKAAQRAWALHLKTESQITNKLGMRLALIPPGEFRMGSPASEVERRADETPHQVRITRPFFLGVYEVTQREWEAVMGSQPSWFSQSGDGKDKVSGLDTSRFPVEQVSWDDADDFCRKLSAREGRIYRLPTEAEWEYACRAGKSTAFHFGNELNGGNANVDGNSPYGTKAKVKYLQQTTAVGSYDSNAFGLYDMHGNVLEWCRDWYDTAYYGRSPTDDPENVQAGKYRVLRGGSWRYVSGHCRAAYRVDISPVNRYFTVGFRVVCATA